MGKEDDKRDSMSMKHVCSSGILKQEHAKEEKDRSEGKEEKERKRVSNKKTQKVVWKTEQPEESDQENEEEELELLKGSRKGQKRKTAGVINIDSEDGCGSRRIKASFDD